jgi:nucleotide-binding universal stress UspA family protein
VTYRTLLVHIDDTRQSNARVSFAIDLAKQYDAHLIGLYVVRPDLAEPAVGAATHRSTATDHKSSHSRVNRANARARFVIAAQVAQCSAQWCAPQEAALDAIVRHARQADLLVFGQHDPDDAASYFDHHLLADALTKAYRSAIVLPRTDRIRPIGEHVLIHWNGSREAARAVSDALPILKRAHSVTVATARRARGAPPARIDVNAWLERHGINTTRRSLSSAIRAVSAMPSLSSRTEAQADLLIMSAQEHAHAHDVESGTDTRTKLGLRKVPVFVSP